jgi:UDP-N-acetylmuramyl pentapeptide phosphotransferase/UDP-N-acetylglucosamine-1-phosphate transferase
MTLLATHHSSRTPWSFLAALLLTWVVGLIDDLRGLSPLLRLTAQAAAGGILWTSGWRVPFFESGVPGFVAECVFVALFINAFNFLDGADGLAAGVAGIIAIAYIALPQASHSINGAALAWSLLGACAGFLVDNFPPAKIFMGDSGSTALGMSVAFLSLDFYRSNPGAKFGPVFPILVGLLPLLDLAFAVLRRLRARVSPFRGDRRHFYDLLLARGWSPRSVVLASCAATAVLALIGRLEL